MGWVQECDTEVKIQPCFVCPTSGSISSLLLHNAWVWNSQEWFLMHCSYARSFVLRKFNISSEFSCMASQQLRAQPASLILTENVIMLSAWIQFPKLFESVSSLGHRTKAKSTQMLCATGKLSYKIISRLFTKQLSLVFVKSKLTFFS